MTSTVRRPSHFADSCKEKAARVLLPRVMEWLNADGEDESDPEEVCRELKSSLDHYNDAYDMARAMENNHYWTVDAELVTVLERAWWAMHDAHEEEVALWVREQNIQAKYRCGDTVGFELRWPHKKTGLFSGEVYEVDEAQARYSVFCADLGHVRVGPGTLGIILNFEDVLEK